MKLSVRFAGKSHSIEVDADATVSAICGQLEELTGVLARNQRLICKGKVLGHDEAVASKLSEGSSMMLMASASSSASETQGQAAARMAAQRKAAAPRAALRPPAATVAAAPSIADRTAGWSKTGVVALRGSGLAGVPTEAVALGAAARVVDLSFNRLVALPAAAAAAWRALQRLVLAGNALPPAGVPWDALASLPQLGALELGGNRLHELPGQVGSLTALTLLCLERNALAALPPTLGNLAALRTLRVGHNALAALPPELGRCVELVEVDARGNKLSALPGELSALTALCTLCLDANRLTAVPPALLRGCLSLSTLSLHGNPLTMERLREADGWREFDARRRAKHDKQVDMRVLDSHFDEGADTQEFDHWSGSIHKNRK